MRSTYPFRKGSISVAVCENRRVMGGTSEIPGSGPSIIRLGRELFRAKRKEADEPIPGAGPSAQRGPGMGPPPSRLEPFWPFAVRYLTVVRGGLRTHERFCNVIEPKRAHMARGVCLRNVTELPSVETGPMPARGLPSMRWAVTRVRPPLTDRRPCR